MNILVLNGSPRQNSNTKKLIKAFKEGAESIGNTVNIVDVCKKNIKGCLSCEYNMAKRDTVRVLIALGRCLVAIKV